MVTVLMISALRKMLEIKQIENLFSSRSLDEKESDRSECFELGWKSNIKIGTMLVILVTLVYIYMFIVAKTYVKHIKLIDLRADVTCKFGYELLADQAIYELYSCGISSTNINKNVAMGSHERKKTDLDVKAVHYKSKPVSFNFDSIFCTKFQNLETFDLENLKPFLHTNALFTCINLIHFKLVDAEIQKIPENFFSENTKLTYLNLKRNQLQSLPSNIFRNLKELEILDLSDNQINLLPSKVFSSLTKLKKLFLFNNDLTIIHADYFGTTPQLKIIDLSDNKIDSVDENFVEKTAVAELNMKENVCSRQKSETRDEIKQDLQQCFRKYRQQQEEVCHLKNIHFETIEKDMQLKLTWELNDVNECRIDHKTINIEIERQNCVDDCKPVSKTVFVRDLTTVIDLVPCASYSYKIRSTESAKDLKAGNFVAPADYNGNLSVEEEVFEYQLNMIVKWDYQHKECTKEIAASIDSQNYSQRKTLTESNKRFIDVPGCEVFRISANPVGKDDLRTTQQIKSSKSRPSSVKNITVNQEDKNSFRIHFLQPDYGVNCVTKYGALVVNEVERIEADVTTDRAIQNVYACSNYQINIKAYINDKNYAISSTQNFLTQPRKFIKPEMPKLEYRSNDLVKFKVVPTKDAKNMCKIKKYEVRCTSSEDETDEISGEDREDIVSMRNLQSNKSYNCKARIYNTGLESSEWSASSRIEPLPKNFTVV